VLIGDMWKTTAPSRPMRPRRPCVRRAGSVDMKGNGFLTVSVPTSSANQTRALISQTGRIQATAARRAAAATSAISHQPPSMFPGPSRPTYQVNEKRRQFSRARKFITSTAQSAPHRRKAAPRNGKSEILATTRQTNAPIRRPPSSPNQTVANQDQDGGSNIIDGGRAAVTIRGSLSATAAQARVAPSPSPEMTLH